MAYREIPYRKEIFNKYYKKGKGFSTVCFKRREKIGNRLDHELKAWAASYVVNGRRGWKNWAREFTMRKKEGKEEHEKNVWPQKFLS